MKESKYPSIGRNIRDYRKSNGYTQQQIADKLGIERANLAKIETNVSTGSIEILIKISNLLGISLNSLLEIDDESKIIIEMPPKLKKDFFSFCSKIGLTPNSAFNLFAAKAVIEQKIPFAISQNNNENQ